MKRVPMAAAGGALLQEKGLPPRRWSCQPWAAAVTPTSWRSEEGSSSGRFTRVGETKKANHA